MILRSLRVTWKSGCNADYTPHARFLFRVVLALIVMSGIISYAWLKLSPLLLSVLP